MLPGSCGLGINYFVKNNLQTYFSGRTRPHREGNNPVYTTRELCRGNHQTSLRQNTAIGVRPKRYGCIFTCMTTRAVHLEVAHSMTANSFINAFRRVICLRTKPHTVFSNNGTNLVGAEKELCQALKDFNHKYVEERVRQKNICWKFNPPTASNFGGIWERLIRSTRKILCMLLQQQTVTKETLQTLFAEVEYILNSRPLTTIIIDPNDNILLTPDHLLKGGVSPNLSPGVFTNADMYSKH